MNIVSWTSLITGYGIHGRGEDAISLFTEMQNMGIVPDGVTYLVVLYTCSHSCMVDEGLSFFERTKKENKVVVGPEHYACAVDLLGRAGRIYSAWEMIQTMPMKPTSIVWVALLSACRNHCRVELAKYASERLIKLDSSNDGVYTLLSNVYDVDDVDDEEKSGLLEEHSEKLALCYGLLTSPRGGMPIRIAKNLRVCGDCHSAFCYVSVVVEREIVLRDSSRFHHFKDDRCSCGGYW